MGSLDRRLARLETALPAPQEALTPEQRWRAFVESPLLAEFAEVAERFHAEDLAPPPHPLPRESLSPLMHWVRAAMDAAAGEGAWASPPYARTFWIHVLDHAHLAAQRLQQEARP
jgi:hypothetical protein